MSGWLRLILAPACALALAGCGGDEISPVSAEDLQVQVAKSVADQMEASPSVLCPAALPARVGAQTTCKITGGTTALIANAKVTKVNYDTGVVLIDVSVSEDVSPSSAPTDSDEPAADEQSPSPAPTTKAP